MSLLSLVFFQKIEVYLSFLKIQSKNDSSKIFFLFFIKDIIFIRISGFGVYELDFNYY